MKSIVFLCVTLVTFQKCANGLLNGLPCNFHESINITGGVQLPNNSITFESVNYPVFEYAEVNYDVNADGQRIPTKPYTRGCFCNVRPCFPVCCPRGSAIKEQTECVKIQSPSSNFVIEIINENNKTVNVTFDERFKHMPCPNGIQYLNAEYLIYYNGVASFENDTLNAHEYCLDIDYQSNGSIYFEVMKCLPEPEQPGDEPSVSEEYVIMISVLGLVITFAVYACISELRNEIIELLFMLYLFNLVMYLAPIAIIYYFKTFDAISCKVIGSIIYFSSLSTGLTLSGISAELWVNYGRTQTALFGILSRVPRTSDRKRIIQYLFIAYVIPFLLTAFCLICESIKSLPDFLHLGIGVTTCAFDDFISSTYLLYHFPQILIHGTNVYIVFSTIRSGEYANSSNNFVLYPCLIFLAASFKFITAIERKSSDFFMLNDILNSSFGIIIFVIFVLNLRVLQLIKGRLSSFISIWTNQNRIYGNEQQFILIQD